MQPINDQEEFALEESSENQEQEILVQRVDDFGSEDEEESGSSREVRRSLEDQESDQKEERSQADDAAKGIRSGQSPEGRSGDSDKVYDTA